MTVARVSPGDLEDKTAVERLLDPQRVGNDPSRTHLDLGKAWDAVASILAPAGDLVRGDRPLAVVEEFDYGPPVILESASIERILAVS